MKKAVALLLALFLSCGLWGCGGCGSGSSDAPSAKVEKTADAATPPPAQLEPPPVPKPAPVEVVATPAIIPPGGVFTGTQLVTISVSTPNAEIHYTTDGSTPTASSPRYTGRIDVTASRTVKALAIRSGMADSDVAQATYSIEAVGTVSTPVINPPGGTFYVPQTVTLASPTLGATIRYTTDGSEPGEASPAYGGPIPVAAGMTLKAFAVKEGMKRSTVAVAAFKITGSVAPVTLSPAGGNYSSTQRVTLSTPTPGAAIHYTLDGTTPTPASPVYAQPLEFDASATLFAVAFLPDWEPSPLASARYRFFVATPTITPGSGNLTAPATATIATATAGAEVRYTTDGSAPGPASALYVGPFEVASSLSLRAIALKQGWEDSGVAEASWRMPVAAPVVTPPAGSYSEPQAVTISTTTQGATIRYTLDGSNPTIASERYVGQVRIQANATLKAAAFKEEWSDSSVTAANYVFKTQPPAFYPSSGSYVGPRQVTISCPTPSAQLRYTTDGSGPTASSPLYAGPITVGASQTLKALALAEGWEPSPVAEAVYEIAVEQPVVSPPGGVYADHQSVTLTSATPGARIFYTLDGSAPTDKSPLSSGAIAVRRPLTLKAVAVASGMVNSTVVSVGYTIDRLPDSGQKLCYDARGEKTPCPATGQDGEVSILPMSFKDNGDGTVTDNVTGMLWQKQDDNKTREWEGANSYCEELKLGGFSDWRLPTRRELVGIVDFSRVNPAIDPTVFPGTATRYYWSSTVSPFVNNGVWALSFDNGFLVDVSKTGFSYYARCVR